MVALKYRSLCGLLLLGGVLSLDGCKGCRQSQHPDAGAAVPSKKSAPKKHGLTFRLEPGQGMAGRTDPVRRDPGRALDAADLARLMRRVPKLKEQAGDRKAFAFRARSLPPPRTGKTITTPFPPPQKPRVPAARAAGPLKVLRASPKDDVPIAPNLSVTFSQPMVAVSSHAETVAKGVPVKLRPAVDGTWRWIGTRTLLFEPKPRFAMATRFALEVPAGTKSAVGGSLARAERWSFSTPPPQVVEVHPRGSRARLATLVFVRFDQRIAPSAVAATISLRGGDESIALRPANQAEIAEDKRVAARVEGAEKGRWVALKPTRRLKADTTYTIKVGKGTPSAEGPRKTEKDQTFTFRTYPPLTIEHQNCTRAHECQPLSGFYLRFSNRLDAESFNPRGVRVRPAIPGMEVRVSYRALRISGQTKGRTEYRVTVPASLEDVHGQTLGVPATRTFHVGSATPRLFALGRTFRVLDPAGERKYVVHSINHKQLEVELYRVKPADWPRFQAFASGGLRREVPATPPGTRVYRRRIRVDGKADELTRTAIDLAPALAGGKLGQVVLVVKQVPFPQKRWDRQFVVRWLQVTQLAVDAICDGDKLTAWVTRLADGRAVSGADVAVIPGPQRGKTDAGGLARLDPVDKRVRGRVLVARAGGDTVMLPESIYRWGGSQWHKRKPPGERATWYVFDDRKLYKPKEEVSVKGWVRLVDMAGAGIRLLPEAVKTLRFTVKGPRGNRVGGGTARIGALGGFDLKFKLPDNVNLGTARLELALQGTTVTGGTHRHAFRIQEFRRPEFEVRSTASEGPHLIGGHAEFQVKASYFAGGALPHAKVSWQVHATRASFTPPNRHGYTFVGHLPSNLDGHDVQWDSGSTSFDGLTDGRGVHRLRVHFDAVSPSRPVTVQATATVVDVNRQSWTTSSRMLVHPAARYVGIKTERYFYQRGQPLVVKTIVSDLEGKLVAGQQIALKAERLQWKRVKDKWVRQVVATQRCSTTSKASAADCRFKSDEGGYYLISAEITDAKGRRNRATIRRWVAGGKTKPERRVKLQRVRLLADKKSYQPGDVAEILVAAPFAGAEGLVTLRRAKVLETRRLQLKGSSTTIKVPIKESYLPNLTVTVDLAGKTPRLDDAGREVRGVAPRPAHATGTLALSIPPLARKLALEVKPAHPRASPGSQTSIDVAVKDAAGKPVAGAEVAVVVVDESVLALTGYALGDPLATFYPRRSRYIRTERLRRFVRLEDPQQLKMANKQAAGQPGSAADVTALGTLGTIGKGGGGGRGRMMERKAKAKRPAPAKPAPPGEAEADKEGAAPQKIAVRKDFSALALFAPALRTDAQGQASVPFKLPDSLTRYRVMAVAVAEAKYYGQSEATITARLPLMIRPSPPRFLNFGDRFDLPIVLQNQTDQQLPVKIGLQATNLVLTQGGGRALTVPAADRVEVRFPAKAVEPGTARVQIAVATGDYGDAARLSIPVWTPATTEAFATYGTIDKGATAQPVKLPKGVVPQFGGLEVSTSSTALQALTDAVLYLVSYPFECSEQISSRVVAVAALRDVLAAFKAKGMPSAAKVVAAVDRDLKRLRGMQNSDGGFPFWRRGRPSWPFLSNHVVHALVRAKAKGFTVPPRMLTRGLSHLKRIESYIPWWYSKAARRAVIAYSIYVRALAGDHDVAKAKRLYAELAAQKKPSMESIGWLYPVLAKSAQTRDELAAVRKLLNERVAETAATAHFATSYSDGAHVLLHSSRRVDAILLEGLIGDQPKSDLIVKLVRGLLDHRKRGRWASTQENAWVLLALDRYFNTYEKVRPNFIARVWLGPRFAGQHAFRGRTTERHRIAIPMKVLAGLGGPADLTLAKKGAGRLYYRIGMRYAPADLKPPPADHGFTVRRHYEAVDQPGDVKRDKDGTWRVRAGARVRVKLRLVATARRYHVALVDPLPAGLEPINAALRGAQTARPLLAKRRGRASRGRRSRGRRWRWRWWGPWYEHQNIRDERVEAFTSLLWSGVHDYEYLARATTPGTFVVPPPKAEEMYHPETFGRGPGDRLIVE